MPAEWTKPKQKSTKLVYFYVKLLINWIRNSKSKSQSSSGKIATLRDFSADDESDDDDDPHKHENLYTGGERSFVINISFEILYINK